MKAKLIKKEDHYFLEVEPYTLSNLQRHTIIANTFDKPKGHILQLSLKNCQAIERGYDLDELAKNLYKESLNYHLQNESDYTFGVIDGFQKALELMCDKKFSEDDVRKAIMGFYMSDKILIESNINKQIQSLQQTEWNVEVEMESNLHIGEVADDSYPKGFPTQKTKLDADGCLILKRAE